MAASGRTAIVERFDAGAAICAGVYRLAVARDPGFHAVAVAGGPVPAEATEPAVPADHDESQLSLGYQGGELVAGGERGLTAEPAHGQCRLTGHDQLRRLALLGRGEQVLLAVPLRFQVRDERLGLRRHLGAGAAKAT